MQIPWSRPDITLEERLAVLRVLDSGWVSVGEETAKFECELAKYIGCKDVVVFNSGTSALVAALLAHKAYDWRRVKHLPTYTFPATLNAVMAAGGGQYSDFNVSDIQYMPINNLTVNAHPPTKSAFNANDIYIPVSFAGLPLDRDTWGDFGESMVEDAAESFGAKSSGCRTGNQGWDAIFSFHAAKLITMIEGGAVATNNLERGEKLRCIRAYGESTKEKGVFTMRGLNMKPSDIHSAIGRTQLRKVNEYIDQRAQIVKTYKELLGDAVEYQYVPDHVERHGNMMMPVFVDDPGMVAAKLKEEGIATRLGWAPMSDDQWAKHIYEHVLCLPLYNTMLESEAEYVSTKILEAVR